MIAAALVGPGSALVRWNRIEVVVRAGADLEHFRRRLDRPDRRWELVGVVTRSATGPGRLGLVGGRLCASVPQADGPAAYRLAAGGWEPAWSVPPASGDLPAWAPTAAQLGVPLDRLRGLAAFTVGRRRQLLTDEDGSVFTYRQRPDGHWERDSCLRVAEPGEIRRPGAESVKLAQVSGELDATAAASGLARPTLSRSVTAAGVRGTDLGVRVEHAGRSFLLFGDTHWAGRPWLAARDAIAEVTPAGPVPGLPGVRFHGSPLKLVGAGTTQREYDVPLDGFSVGGRLHAFFSSNHFRDRRVMGRSVLARAVEPEPVIDPGRRRRPLRFAALGTFSDRHFINVSLQLRPAASVPGFGGDGEVLLIWGTGAYRASELRLAALDPLGLPASASAVRYWHGSGWSGGEEAAQPLFGPAALGEISVRWVPAVGRYLLLSAAGPGDPAGPAITLRTAVHPWGPWSDRIRLLDWVASGMAHDDPHTRFIRAHAQDPVGDRLFRAQAAATGAAYAPHLFSAEVDAEQLVLRYTLSTWNPYQVVLMEHRLPVVQI